MTAKKKSQTPKGGGASPEKKPAKREPVSPASTPTESEPASTGDSSGVPSPVSATVDSPSPESAPENVEAALSVLDSAQAALLSEPVAPVAPAPAFGGATDAEAVLRDAGATNAGNAELPKRKGGWPKGRPRSGFSASGFAGKPTSVPVGTTSDALTLARARQRIAELEAQNSEQVKVAMSLGFAQLAKIGFGIVARRNGVHWFLSPDEATEIGAACGNAALPYVSYIAPALPFIAAIGAVYGSVSMRMEIDTEIAEGKRARIMPGDTPNA